MRGGPHCCPDVEGANITKGGSGSVESWTLYRRDTVTRNLSCKRPVGLTRKIPLPTSARSCINFFKSRSHTGSHCQGSRRVGRSSTLVSTLRRNILFILVLHCSASFCVPRPSNLPRPAGFTKQVNKIELHKSPVGIIETEAAEAVATNLTENSDAEINASAFRTKSALLSPQEKAASYSTASPKAASARAALLTTKRPVSSPLKETTPQPARLTSFHTGANRGDNDSGSASSLLATRQALSAPGHLPAGYQRYREMLKLLRTLATTQCPALDIVQRRRGPLKVDVISLQRNAGSARGSSRSSGNDSQQQQSAKQRVFILTGEHPRELLPPAVLLRFVQFVCGGETPALPEEAESSEPFSSSSLPSSFDAVRRDTTEKDTNSERETEKNEDEDTEAKSRSDEHRRDSSQSETDRHVEADRFQHLLDVAEFRIILNANPLAREKVEEGEYCRRGTLTNVDLNRNWSAFWDSTTRETSDSALATSDDGASAETLTGGPSPFSEPETQLLKELLVEYQPTMFISVHSGSLGIYTPYGFADQKPLAHGHHLQRVASMVARSPLCRNVAGGGHCVTGTAGRYFSARGNCLDWVYSYIKPTPLVFLMEIYRGEDSKRGAVGPAAAERPYEEGTENQESDSSFVQAAVSETKPGAPAQQHLAVNQAANEELGAGDQVRFPGVHTPGNQGRGLAAKQKSWPFPQLLATRHKAPIHSHVFPLLSREARMGFLHSDVQSSGDALHNQYAGGADILDSTYNYNNNSIGNERDKQNSFQDNKRRSSLDTGRTANMSLLETQDAASAATEGAMAEQSHASADDPEYCFRLFNPHTSFTREQAVNNWAELLRQLVEEAHVQPEEDA